MDRHTQKEYREAIIAFLLERDGNNCQICNQALDSTIAIDHIIPLSKEGKNRLNNMQLAHSNCNSIKSNTTKPILDWWEPLIAQRPKDSKQEPTKTILTRRLVKTSGRKRWQRR